jgi:hypothetical protein
MTGHAGSWRAVQGRDRLCRVVTGCAGELWTVNPVAVNSVDVFTENRRNVTYLQSTLGRLVAYICGQAPPQHTACGRSVPVSKVRL